MAKKESKVILQDYEYLMGARNALARGNQNSYRSFLEDIRKDVSGEYTANVDSRIERWIDVTRTQYWLESQSVEYYIQAKMLYRDGFFEATIMMARSVCEMVVYELLDKTTHPFGGREEVEKQNFRKLVRYIFDETKLLPKISFDRLHEIYDVGNNYVHPKANQNPKEDSRSCLLKLGEALWHIYGAEIEPGVTIKTAYAAFPEICGLYGFPIEAFATPEAAARNARRWTGEI